MSSQEPFLAFIEGVGLIVSPCILPVLPLVLATSLTGGKWRPLGIIVGFIASFALFALLARQLIAFLAIDPQILQNVALWLLVALGVVMVVPRLEAALSDRMKNLASWGDRLTSKWGKSDGFSGGLLIGSLIGLVWTPCAGPIMAVAVVQIIQAKTDFTAALIVVMFALGAAIPMLIIALTGRSMMQKLGFLKNYAHRLRQVLGLVIIAAALLLYSGVATRLLAGEATTAPQAALTDGLKNALQQPVPAPEFVGIQNWVNSAPLTMAGLRGKVVLIDFWTYSCINCVRTLPYLTAWDQKYRDKGLVIIGVHAPEFEFEKKLTNVQQAVTAHGIRYPVALDNELATWSAFANRYWPAHYLINQAGQVVYTHFGEGEYDTTEHNIRTLLGITDETRADVNAEAGGSSALQSPETYLGYERGENFSSTEPVGRDEAVNYSFGDFLLLNHWALAGQWQISPQLITAKQAGAKLRYNFVAGRVFLVLGSTDGKPVQVRLTLNGKPLGDKAGKDVKNSSLTVDRETLYELVNQGGVSNGILELEAVEAGLQAYAFTFGK